MLGRLKEVNVASILGLALYYRTFGPVLKSI